VAGLVALAGVLAGCSGDGGSTIPLPGGAPAGDHYRVTAEFEDVLDLVPEASVKVDDVTVGSVERIRLHDWTAQVRMRIDSDVTLPDNASAAVRQTSLLGEKFVALDPPAGGKGTGRLGNGDVIPLSRTRRGVEVEEVLAAMSLVLNGGGLENLRTINREIGDALDGRETDVKAALNELDTFVAGLDDQKEDIVRAIDALDKLSARLADERGTVASALDAAGPGLKVLATQRGQLVAMLDSLRRLGKVGTRVIRESRDETVSVLRDLRPILTQLVRSGDSLPKSLDYLLTYPLPANVTGAIHGDMVNLRITMDLDAVQILKNLTSDPEPAPPPEPADGDSDDGGGDEGDGGPGDGSVVPVLPPGESESRQGDLTDLLTGGLLR
jgi:phospholipid/cholesterol/gamma-HCH transport system substrate-binding protein